MDWPGAYWILPPEFRQADGFALSIALAFSAD
jgi:hypothetical protein